MGERVTIGDLLLTEYQALKEEQRARIGFRDNLLYAMLAAIAAVVAAVLQAKGRPELLLLLPPVSVLLGWTYLANDEKISAAGRYVREELAPRLASLANASPASVSPSPDREEPRVFGWEIAHRADARRRSRKLLQLAVDLLAFCAIPLAALVVFWVAGDAGVVLVAVSVLELLAVAALGGQIVRYSDLTASRGPDRG
ncbi:hypothetical protein AB0903_19405 [Streptomyces sp. NPDC048389]|uniref:hypothetical protein n=1 Tax=Streptomyces sp. NPDC048389 TaxID=3154622 RepID=UPI003455C5A7